MKEVRLIVFVFSECVRVWAVGKKEVMCICLWPLEFEVLMQYLVARKKFVYKEESIGWKISLEL